ncbi:MAG: hypothetical protein IJE07_06825 [Clostridia bacterium]|nr:hypothetical protein [Clostridia bacterium]
MRLPFFRRYYPAFGSVPDPLYFAGDMEHIRAYHDARAQAEPGRFVIDDVTWNDLDMDRLFRRINPGLTTSGEQYLYDQLRTPAGSAQEHQERAALIDLMAEDGALRERLTKILRRLGCARRADLSCAFAPRQHGWGWLVIYLALMLLFITSLCLAPLLGESGVLLPLVCLIVNGLTHEFRRTACERDYATVNYSVRMVYALHRIRRLRHAGIDAHVSDAYACIGRMKAVLRVGGVSPMGGDMVADMFNTVLLTDLIAYEFLKNKLGRCHGEIFRIHEALGKLDAAMAVASFRASQPGCCVPEVGFSQQPPRIDMRGMRHPLTPEAVPNDVDATRPILVTGSNASGKSTFLKAVMLNAILAQTLCTATCGSCRMTAFRPMTSMALRDDLAAGESYYIVEIRSLKRILDAARQPGLPVLCAVDEVLRGTNTIERIAASCEALRALASTGAMCLAATHDLELCALLESTYDLYHFEEQVTGEAVSFDYRLRPGPATTRNAIRLLRLMGFPEDMVDAADARAAAFLQTGAWRT